MQALTQGRYVARLAQTRAEVAQAQDLRHLAFHAARGRGAGQGRDQDAFDATARHLLILTRDTGALVACARVQTFIGQAVQNSYSAQFYDLARLTAFPGPMIELGRFCLHPACHDPDVLRLAWGALARLVDAAGATLLFGCSSFDGAGVTRHAAALGALLPRVAPDRWRPGLRAPLHVALSDCVGQGSAKEALAATPALLRTYLGMGAWVSDHAVIDPDLDTVHVLVGVEIAKIPAARVRALRQIGTENVG